MVFVILEKNIKVEVKFLKKICFTIQSINNFWRKIGVIVTFLKIKCQSFDKIALLKLQGL